MSSPWKADCRDHLTRCFCARLPDLIPRQPTSVGKFTLQICLDSLQGQESMASKEATVYIVDQGSSTGECHNGRVENDLDFGMRYIWDKIAETMIANRTTAGVGVIGFRTDATENELAESDPDAYSNISVMKPLGPMEISHLKDLQHGIQPNDTDTGDAISAIVVGIQLIEKFTTLKTGKPGKFARKIILLTDGQGVLEDDDIDPIAARINELDIELVIVYVLPRYNPGIGLC